MGVWIKINMILPLKYDIDEQILKNIKENNLPFGLNHSSVYHTGTSNSALKVNGYDLYNPRNHVLHINCDFKSYQLDGVERWLEYIAPHCYERDGYFAGYMITEVSSIPKLFYFSDGRLHAHDPPLMWGGEMLLNKTVHTVVIPLQLWSFNKYNNVSRKNKFEANKYKQHIEFEIGLHLKKLPKITNPVNVNITWVLENKKTDPDNASSSKKFVIDALVKVGILPNDGHRWIRGFSDKFEFDKDNPRIILKLEVIPSTGCFE